MPRASGPPSARSSRLRGEHRLAGQRAGAYTLHCHNLVPVDHDMMGQSWINGPSKTASPSGATSPDVDPHHPVNAAPAQPRDDQAHAQWAGIPDTDNLQGF